MSTTIPAPVGWFEIAGSDPAKLESFYGAVLGWTFADGPTGAAYRMTEAGGGVGGGITSAVAGTPGSYAIFCVAVPDVAATCDRIAELGGRVLVGPETVAETGLVYANVEDPEGNHFGVFCPPAG